jgi:hypothetical protein
MRKNGCQLVLVLALIGLCAGEAAAQMPAATDEATGVVARVDERQKVVIFDDGRMVRATPATVIMVNGQPATVGSLKPGTRVAIRSGEPVMVNAGQYVGAGDSAAAGIPSPAVRARTFGRVKDIDRDGDVKIQTQSGTFHIKISPDAARQLKNGDTATVDVVITPPAPTVR